MKKKVYYKEKVACDSLYNPKYVIIITHITRDCFLKITVFFYKNQMFFLLFSRNTRTVIKDLLITVSRVQIDRSRN